MIRHTDFRVSQTVSFFELLRAEMLRMPDAIIASPGCRATYGEVLDMVGAIRAGLPEARDDSERTIAICAEKSPETVAAILASLAGGFAYAPLDPAHPDTRLTEVLEDLRPALLIVDAESGWRLGAWAADHGMAMMDLSHFSAPMQGPVPDPLPLSSPRVAPAAGQALAAVLHTSGSTGKPKRVLIEAPALVVFQEWAVEELSLEFDDCLFSHAPFAFDLSFLDLFAALASGAGIALADTATARNGARMIAMLREHDVTVWHSAPSALRLLAEAAGDTILPGLRCVLFAGEPMPARLLRRLFRIFPNARFINIYGCTETNDTFFYDVPRDNTPDPLPLGHKLPYVDCLIMDDAGHPVTGEGEGELWVRCPTMMRGYHDPDLTAQVTGWHDGRAYFLSRDRVRRSGAGTLEFVGRMGSIVKLNGVRVDLNEVETLLLGHPQVDEAAAYIDPRPEGYVLNAYVASRVDILNSIDLRLHLAKRLPKAAIPRRFIISDQGIPKNSNGKSCRRMLARHLAEFHPH